MSEASGRITLDGLWQCQPDWNGPAIANLPQNIFQKNEWILAEVPGTIHTDLMASGKIPDPFRDDNENAVQWVGEIGWRCHRKFEVDREFLRSEAIELCAEGLDTFAHIKINGMEVGRTENMFVLHHFEVKPLLRNGENEIEIIFDSPIQRTRALEEQHRKMAAALQTSRVYARKAQYSFGWDWGPTLATSGIWRPIYLLAHDKVRLQNLRIDSQLDGTLQQATVVAHVECAVTTTQPVKWTATLEGPQYSRTVQKESHELNLAFVFEIDRPHLWWPNGLGERAFYYLTLTAESEGKQQLSIRKRIGLRRVELVTAPEAGGESFRFRINNVPVFCKGADWIPADNFIPRIPTEKYRTLLTMARDANMNMLRVWGGGIYEQPVFYEICDELGLMIWQDFMFACATYPEHEAFVENVRREVRTVVRRLRDHPCIVLWCGNNENEWIWHQATGRPYSEMPGVKLFDTVIPEILAVEDPGRPYRQSSPFGGEDPNAEEFGNRHQWEMWSRWASPNAVQKDRSRFVAEFGFQSPACLKTWQENLRADQLRPQSPIMEHHNKQVEGPERLYRFLAAHFNVPEVFDQFVYKCQVMQAEALQTCIAHWRRRKFLTSGALFWQLNDCWPVSSWSVIDGALRPKAAYWYAKRFFAPVILAPKRAGDYVEFYAVNDTLQNQRCEFEVTTLDVQGETFYTYRNRALIPANTSIRLFAHQQSGLKISDRQRHYVRARLLDGDKVLAVNRYFFVPFKHFQLEKPNLRTSLTSTGSGCWRLHIATDRFVKALFIQLPEQGLQLSDNFCDVDAGEELNVDIHTAKAGVEIALSDIRLQWID
jgi:beta-mannosidase